MLPTCILHFNAVIFAIKYNTCTIVKKEGENQQCIVLRLNAIQCTLHQDFAYDHSIDIHWKNFNKRYTIIIHEAVVILHMHIYQCISSL